MQLQSNAIAIILQKTAKKFTKKLRNAKKGF